MPVTPVTISVVTPVLNRVETIGDALDSVRRDRPDGVEHIVMDGLSTDGTLDILSGRDDIDLVSRRDRNLYDAINAGFARARGDVLVLLNSDDVLPPGTLARIRDLFAAHPGTPHVTGGMEIVRGDGSRRIFDHPDFLSLDLANLIAGPTNTNSRFVTRALAEAVGPFDIRIPVVADRDWLIRLRRLAPIGVTTPEVLYTYRSGYGSLTMDVDAPDPKLIAGLADAALLRASETVGTPIFEDYARWAAWAQFRRDLLEGHGLAGVSAALSRAPAGFLRQVTRQVVGRRRRRGRNVSG